jgi:hypothetical protein
LQEAEDDEDAEEVARITDEIAELDGGGAAAIPQPDAASTIQEGQTATNKATGEKLVFRNGKWQPL